MKKLNKVLRKFSGLFFQRSKHKCYFPPKTDDCHTQEEREKTVKARKYFCLRGISPLFPVNIFRQPVQTNNPPTQREGAGSEELSGRKKKKASRGEKAFPLAEFFCKKNVLFRLFWEMYAICKQFFLYVWCVFRAGFRLVMSDGRLLPRKGRFVSGGIKKSRIW